jgi:hypothetical protein
VDKQETTSEAALRQAYEESEALYARAQAGEPDDFDEEVRITVADTIAHVFEFQVDLGELEEIEDAATAEGVELDDFIREAALARARGRAIGDESIRDVREKLRQLEEALHRL